MKLKILSDYCGRPFLARLTILTLFGCSLKLHIFIRSDADAELHDHPWGFWTFVLCGGYHEVTPDGVITRKPWNLSYRPAKWRHRVALRIKDLGHGRTEEIHCATLLLTTPVKRDWGFWRDGKFIPWREFRSNHDCE